MKKGIDVQRFAAQTAFSQVPSTPFLPRSRSAEVKFKKISLKTKAVFVLLLIFLRSNAISQSNFDSIKNIVLTEMGFFKPVLIGVGLGHYGIDDPPSTIFFIANGYVDFDYEKGLLNPLGPRVPLCVPSPKLKPYIVSVGWPGIHNVRVGKRVFKSISYKNAWTESGIKLQSFKFSYLIEPVLPELPRMGPLQGLGIGIWNPATGEWHVHENSILEDMGTLNMSGSSTAYNAWFSAQETLLKNKVEALIIKSRESWGNPSLSLVITARSLSRNSPFSRDPEASINDIVEIKYEVKNTYKVDLNSVELLDDIPSAFDFVRGSGKIDGVTVAKSMIEEGTGGFFDKTLQIQLGILQPNQIKIITYSCKVSSDYGYDIGQNYFQNGPRVKWDKKYYRNCDSIKFKVLKGSIEAPS